LRAEERAHPLPLQTDIADELRASRWGFVLRQMLDQDSLPSSITDEEIDAIFLWDESVTNDPTCHSSFSQIVIDLLALATGRQLFAQIIAICLKKTAEDECPSCVGFLRGPLKWDGQNPCFDEWMLVITRKGTHTVQHQLDFVGILVPQGIQGDSEAG
jgi:hypothetical protein